ncbi:aphrodisin-like [Mesocricetus auratus]|uniref:Aphrodisin-like n=1 Tax=Mesocricetus auratus TaxID=10036 RepID=A0ABM2X2W8_MESAU|nr:aphrodisin-like [Mesocricetus auratus]
MNYVLIYALFKTELQFLRWIETKKLKMEILLLTAFIIFVSADKLSGEFHTLYLAADELKFIGDNGPLKIYVRHIQFQNNDEMCITFYMRQNYGCQLYAVLAKKFLPGMFITTRNPKPSSTRSQGRNIYITELWMFAYTFSTLPESWVYTNEDGTKESAVFSFLLYFVSSTTLFIDLKFFVKNGSSINFTAALSKEISLSENLWDFFLDLTTDDGIPVENIQDALTNDTCPQGRY